MEAVEADQEVILTTSTQQQQVAPVAPVEEDVDMHVVVMDAQAEQMDQEVEQAEAQGFAGVAQAL